MEELIKKADILIESLPYMKEYSNKTVVIKYGGNAMVNQDLMVSVLEDITLLKYVGVNPVIVHGGGPVISENLKKLNLQSDFYQGLRVTNKEIMEVVEQALLGKVNSQIVSLANLAGNKAVGLSGKDNNLIQAKKYELEDGFDLGHVGEIKKINPEILITMIDNGYLPIVAPVGVDEAGMSYNINADLVAGELAASLGAEKLILLTNVEGILDNPEDKNSLISRLKVAEAQEMIEDGKIVGGMIPKVGSCIKALNQGVKRTHILDGRIPHALLLEIFTESGIGTMID
ncbi:N-acetylglutamate kinase [Orenia metallireducens]|uniref:Acetylglutamate kinase n=1 Tax=Orenia metallireducens TaxID=1413210 RepID=A0A285FKY1_9FIRM|nr:acetylglutamate kinase [Orenia metallireducens]PRX33562.1 N-acetylglutamate kinase [Orenia metallireducens]SNY10891.1 N-acetylglutamate kinase [Orenia metallireducens]